MGDEATLDLDKLFETGVLVKMPRRHRRRPRTTKILFWTAFLVGGFLVLLAG